ncbi:hypothetical protein [Candidatus Enterococcus ferrettii]|uniref:Uncharacterized protein n=1 Tax=Candidatus Enterococcus ferrettii TaxID=2815324 RepID=A0ABV0ELW5_9ENTE|nr:hypothetical protein [Enterococcus sp. 665A]MBO1341230.1 hypothetical protein [Enterococcus sp. 665A]
MQKKTSPEELVGVNPLLDCEKDSDAWQGLLRQTEPYVPQENQSLSLVLPVPERNESVVFYQGKSYYYPKQTLTTLKTYEKAHNFLDYPALTRVLRRLNCFGYYRMPMVSFTSVLFPLGKPNHTVWINPFEIVELKEEGPFTWIHLCNGPTIKVCLTSQTIRNYAEIALLILATVERDHFSTGMIGPISPLSVLGVPDTPFARSLSQRPRLQKFPLPLRLLKEAYEKELALQTILRFGYQSGLDRWNHRAFFDLFDQ